MKIKIFKVNVKIVILWPALGIVLVRQVLHVDLFKDFHMGYICMAMHGWIVKLISNT